MRFKCSARAPFAACAGLLLSFAATIAQAGPLRPVEGLAQVALGFRHACGLTEAGGVQCWGTNNVGVLGLHPQILGRMLPEAVSLPKPATQLALGMYFTCALLDDGTVHCWGDNAAYQLGNANVFGYSWVPSPVEGLAGPVAAISAGYRHACALLQDGSLQCWGENSSGQLGIDTTTPRELPITVPFAARVTQVVAGTQHTCAISAGSAWCWGENANGRLGIAGAASADQPTRVTVISGTPTALALGSMHSCALMAGGEVRCWGQNWFMQLGRDDRWTAAQGEPVPGLPMPVTKIAAGGEGTCALGSDGQVHCWGLNSFGLLGSGRVRLVQPVSPLQFTGEIVSLALYAEAACFVDAEQRAHCSGDPGSGQLGSGTLGSATEPRRVALGTAVASLGARGGHACALAGGAAYCWGANEYGEVGDGTQLLRVAPAGVRGAWTALRVGYGLTCGVTASGAASCWGATPGAQLTDANARTVPTAVPGLATGVADVQGTYETACARMTDGALKCWGDNYEGQLGNGSIGGTIHAPATVTGLESGVTAFDTANSSACALQGGLVKCWGNNVEGRLGHDSMEERSAVPVVAVLPRPALQLGVGDRSACALDDLGDVYCWGSNSHGQLSAQPAVSESRKPLRVDDLPLPARRLHVGSAHVCATLQDDTLWCWGANFNGQLGREPAGWFDAVPAPVGFALPGMTAAVAGSGTTCAVLQDGDAWCWGADGSGALGDGGINYAVPSPVLERNLHYIFDDRFED